MKTWVEMNEQEALESDDIIYLCELADKYENGTLKPIGEDKK